MSNWLKTRSIEDWARLCLVMLVGLAVLVLLLPSLIFLLVLLIVTIPLAIALAFVPDLLLYAGPGLVAFLLARNWSLSRPLAMLVGAASMLTALGVGTLVARQANAATRTAAETFVAGSSSAPVSSDPVGTMVDLVADWDGEGEGEVQHRCTWRCERALFSGFARRYAIGRHGDFVPGSRDQRVSVVHEIVPLAEGCDNMLLFGSHAEEDDFPGRTDRRNLRLWDALPSLANRGLCFRSREADSVAADLVIVETMTGSYVSRDRGDYDWSLRPFDLVQRIEVHRQTNSGLALAARYSQVRYSLVASPLRISLPLSLATHTPGGWSRAGQRTVGADIPVGLEQIFDANLIVSGD